MLLISIIQITSSFDCRNLFALMGSLGFNGGELKLHFSSYPGNYFPPIMFFS